MRWKIGATTLAGWLTLGTPSAAMPAPAGEAPLAARDHRHARLSRIGTSSIGASDIVPRFWDDTENAHVVNGEGKLIVGLQEYFGVPACGALEVGHVFVVDARLAAFGPDRAVVLFDRG